VKIDNNVKSLGSSSVGETHARGTRSGGAKASSGQQSQSAGVQLSPLGSQLSNIEASLANVPVVDAARVAEIKQAITDGQFKVNPEVVADRLIDTVKELIRAHKE